MHEAKEGKKAQEKPRPYAPRKEQGKGRVRENNAPPRYNFTMELADLIALTLGHQLAELVKSGFLADYLREPQGDRASGS